MTYSTIPRMRSAVIVASGHLFPLLAEPTEFLLAATVLVIGAFWAGGDGLVGNTTGRRRTVNTCAGCFRKQPEFAALLESLEQELPYPICRDTGSRNRQRRYPIMYTPMETVRNLAVVRAAA